MIKNILEYSKQFFLIIQISARKKTETEALRVSCISFVQVFIAPMLPFGCN